MNSALKAATHVFNPLAMPVARLGVIPLWGVVRHRGRKSGRMFATPIAVAATGDAFVIPLPWGERTDWCRNIVAAGGGTIRYRGSDYLVRERRPEARHRVSDDRFDQVLFRREVVVQRRDVHADRARDLTGA